MFENNKNKLSLNRPFTNSLRMAKIIAHLANACQVLFLLAKIKVRTKARAKRVMKEAYAQLSCHL
jgi:hypothetical protein